MYALPKNSSFFKKALKNVTDKKILLNNIFDPYIAKLLFIYVIFTEQNVTRAVLQKGHSLAMREVKSSGHKLDTFMYRKTHKRSVVAEVYGGVVGINARP